MDPTESTLVFNETEPGSKWKGRWVWQGTVQSLLWAQAFLPFLYSNAWGEQQYFSAAAGPLSPASGSLFLEGVKGQFLLAGHRLFLNILFLTPLGCCSPMKVSHFFLSCCNWNIPPRDGTVYLCTCLHVCVHVFTHVYPCFLRHDSYSCSLSLEQ